MPNNWKTYKLGELCNITSSKRIFYDEYVSAGIPFYRSKEIILKANLSEITNELFISEEKFNNIKQKFGVPLKDDILLTSVGTIGIPYQVRENDLFYFKDGNLTWIKDFKEHISSDYLIQWIKSNTGKDAINGITIGSTQSAITIQGLKNLEVILPPLPEQKSIAQILSAIDDKIENNLAINKTLEEMAMAIYKHWFVDFGPFQDGEFVESELGRIPKGWEVKRLENFVEVLSKGTTPRMKDVEGLERKIPFLKVKDINSDGEININGLELIPEETHLKDLKRSILFENDLLFSIAGTIGRVSIVTEKLNNSNCNQALAFIRLKEREKFKAIIYYWLKSDDVQNKIQNSIVQGVQANVSLTVLKELELIEPSNEILIDFANKVNPILELVLKNQKENQTLTQLRDTLLPKLISGEVRLKEFKESITN